MYSPAEVARRYVETGKSKAALPVGRMLLLGMLAGAFIALAGGSATFAVSYGGRLAGAAVFPAGLAMVLLAGSELFTGNCLLVIPLLERQLTWGRMLTTGASCIWPTCWGPGQWQLSPWRQAPSTGCTSPWWPRRRPRRACHS